MRRFLVALAFALALVASLPVLADVRPEPSRPMWNDPPAPLPDPPEDVRAAFALAALLTLMGGVAIARTRPSVARSAA